MKRLVLSLAASLFLAACSGGSGASGADPTQVIYDRCKDLSAADRPTELQGQNVEWPELKALGILSGDISDHWILKGTASGVSWACLVDDESGRSEVFWGDEAEAVPLIWWKADNLLEGGDQPVEGGTVAGGSEGGPVSLQIIGSAPGVDVTIGVDSQISQQAGAPVPFQRTVTAPSGTFVQIMGQSTGTSGTVTCQILQRGRVLSEQTSSGAFVIAACSATVG